MTDTFRDTLTDAAPPADAAPALQALWWAGKGDWQAAHRLVQQHEGEHDSDLVHAHLHRQEGDLGNARAWYAGAGEPFPTLPLALEWDAIAARLRG